MATDPRITVALGVAACRRALARTAAATLGRALALAGYPTSPMRDHVAQQELLKRRGVRDQQYMESGPRALARLLEHTKAKYDRHAAGAQPEAPVINALIISGGGDWGAFGAAFLKGWQQVSAQHPLAQPAFDIVTGVSTGTLIAPFAFLGDPQSIDRIAHLYRNPETDWVKQRGALYFLPNNISFAEVPGLERQIREHLTMDMVRRIAEAGADGRVLAVNTTNLDDASSRVFDLVAEARLAVDSGRLDRIHNIMLASAGIPGAFPFRLIDGELYVDGGVTGNVVYGGQAVEDQTLPGLWQRAYPGLPLPRMRFWVIFNNQFRPPPQVVEPRWTAVIQRSLETATRASTATALRHFFAMAEIARYKRNADIEIRVVSIPGDWSPPVPGVFVKETMNDLADMGERMGADPASWSDDRHLRL